MKVINQHSEQANDHIPSTSAMEYGEIAVNYNSTNPRLLIKDSDDKIVGFPSEGKVNKQFDEVDEEISNLEKNVSANTASIDALDSWVDAPLTEKDIKEAFGIIE
jgi:hypothetical protein